MAKPLTRCPKCSRKITNRFECRNCGLIFDRYFKVQARKRAEEQKRAGQKAKFQQIVSTVLIFILIIAAGGGYYYYSQQKSSEQLSASTPVPVTPADQLQSSLPQANPADKQTSPAITKNESPLNLAYGSIVTVKSPWAQGLGFFIKDEKIITSKLIVAYSEENLQKDMQELEQLLGEIDQNEEQLQVLKKHYSSLENDSDKEPIAVNIKEYEKWLAQAKSTRQDLENKLSDKQNNMDAPDIVIYLADGSEARMAYMDLNSAHGFALLTVYDTNIQGVKIAQEALSPETPVYTVGLNKRVIKGIFSEYSQDDFHGRVIKTDAPIGTRYNLGPLMDEKGYIHGISILSQGNDEATGLAIPIGTVLNEFNL